MRTAWTKAEEALIAELKARFGISRAEAIRRLRAVWLIGELPPPGWPLSLPLAKERKC